MTFSLPYEIGNRLRRKYPQGAFCRIVGDSMEPTLFDGDLVLVDLSRQPRFNDVACVWIEGRGKIVGRWRGATLAKDNAAFAAIGITGADKVYGPVVVVVERDIGDKTVDYKNESWMNAALIWKEGPKAREMRLRERTVAETQRRRREKAKRVARDVVLEQLAQSSAFESIDLYDGTPVRSVERHEAKEDTALQEMLTNWNQTASEAASRRPVESASRSAIGDAMRSAAETLADDVSAVAALTADRAPKKPRSRSGR